MLNEDYKVELLKKLPVYHRRIYEYQQIAKVQTPELEKLLIAIDFVLDNWFIETASEYGLSRLEKIAGITSAVGEDLEARRYRLFMKMTEKIPYTDKTLKEWLSSMCGGTEYYEIVKDYSNYKITINTTLGGVGIFEEICNALVKMIPCNLVLEVYNTITDHLSMGLNYGIAVSVAMKHTITHDINISNTLNMSLLESMGVSGGSVKNITHDIHTEANSSMNMYSPMGVSVSGKEEITHDIHTIENLNMSLYNGIGVSDTEGVSVSHDAIFKETLTSNATVVIPTTTATIITME